MATRKEWFSHYRGEGTIHVADIRLSGQIHNNKMERQNGETRDREKIMQGLKQPDSPAIKGLQINLNFPGLTWS